MDSRPGILLFVVLFGQPLAIVRAQTQATGTGSTSVDAGQPRPSSVYSIDEQAVSREEYERLENTLTLEHDTSGGRATDGGGFTLGYYTNAGGDVFKVRHHFSVRTESFSIDRVRQLSPTGCKRDLRSALSQDSVAADAGLNIAARMYPERIKVGGDAALILTMSYRGHDKLIVPHPLGSTEALVLHVRMPSGVERTMRVPSRRAGQAPSKTSAVLHPGISQRFPLSLPLFLPDTTNGAYCIAVDYEWAPGKIWRSSALSLELVM